MIKPRQILKMNTESKLKEITDKFFELHWNKSLGVQPEWSNHWKYYGTIPNNDKRGCYALFEGDNLVKVGIGIGHSVPRYYGSGLGERLKKYQCTDMSKNDRHACKPTEQWKDLTSLMTIGFDESNYYLAAALEVYLIINLKPMHNKEYI